MASVFDYIFNIGGNFSAQINGMSAAAGTFSASVEGADSGVRRFTGTLATFSYLKDVFQNVADGVTALSRAGITLDRQMHDLSAVAGVTGDGLKQIETFARESAKAFGTDASVAVEGYKLLLSQLSPELGKYPEALRSMGDCIQTTSKLMGGDGVAAAQVLTTAMNQYGVSLEDPTAASEEMARMMNVMAAAGQTGSAELPAISAALQQCGMAAKAANVSFEETNAAIQVLDKAGKKASEGGVALRNVLGQLSKGRFVEKQAAEELQKAGIDVTALGDNTKSLKERLEMLKPMLNDSALLSKFFGVENANAARALIQGTDALQDFTDAVTGTSSATDQAAIVMESYAERQAQVNQKIEDFKISLFQATGDLSIWCSTLATALVPLAQMAPLLTAVWKCISSIVRLPWLRWITTGYKQLAIFNVMLTTSSSKLLVIAGNIGVASLSLIRFASIGIFNALKGLGALILSLITGGSTSATFAATASTSFGIFAASATAACNTVSAAIMSIPIIGWIAAIISALIAVVTYFWNTSAEFRAQLKGSCAAFEAFFNNIWEMAKTTFGALGELIKAAFELDSDGIKAALDKMNFAQDKLTHKISEGYHKAYDAEIAAAAKESAAEEDKANKILEDAIKDSEELKKSLGKIDVINNSDDPLGDILGGTGGTNLGDTNTGNNSGGDSGGKIRNITINIEKLVERFEIHSGSVRESAEQMKAVVLETLMGALNDTQLAIN